MREKKIIRRNGMKKKDGIISNKRMLSSKSKKVIFVCSMIGLIALAVLFSKKMLSCKEEVATFMGFRAVGDERIMTDSAQWGELNTHDPSIIKADGYYYVFSTDASYGNMHKLGIQIRKSKDLITWEYVGTAFQNFEEDCAEVIEYAKLDVSKHDGLWAPDVVYVDGVYRMYYSASTFGSSRSCIGLAESKKIEGPYVHKGIVYESQANAVTNPNAIDPAFIADREGNMYMSYGSFFGGIFIVPLEASTGFIKEGSEAIRIAGSRGASVEGSYIVYVKETDYYYLFVSYGSLSSDYNVRVSRAKEVTGPYEDINGNRMDQLALGNQEKIGTKIMGGYTFLSDPGVLPSKGYMAPGHNSVLMEDDAYYMVHHTRTYKLPHYWFYMNVRGMTFNRFGWPVVYPNRYHGETLEPILDAEGEYAVVEHLSDNNAKAHESRKAEFTDGLITGALNGSYRIYEDYKFELIVDEVIYDGVIIKQYDWERECEVMAFTVMSEDGACIWGSTQL